MFVYNLPDLLAARVSPRSHLRQLIKMMTKTKTQLTLNHNFYVGNDPNAFASWSKQLLGQIIWSVTELWGFHSSRRRSPVVFWCERRELNHWACERTDPWQNNWKRQVWKLNWSPTMRSCMFTAADESIYSDSWNQLSIIRETMPPWLKGYVSLHTQMRLVPPVVRFLKRWNCSVFRNKTNEKTPKAAPSIRRCSLLDVPDVCVFR